MIFYSPQSSLSISSSILSCSHSGFPDALSSAATIVLSAVLDKYYVFVLFVFTGDSYLRVHLDCLAFVKLQATWLK